MSKRNRYDKSGLTIDYSIMGIMTLEEFKQALWTDLEVLKRDHGAKYVQAPKLKVEFTNEFGEQEPLRNRSSGRPIYRMHTRYYRPACQDFDF